MNIGQSIKKIREWRNYTQEYMAEALDMSQQNYSKMELDEIDFPISRIEKVAKVLDVSVADIFNLDNKSIFNNYNVDVTNSGEGNNIGTIVKDTQLIEKLEKQYEARIEDLKKEIEHLKTLLEKTL